ncbi:integrase [Bacillus pseudomycoides]|uniref:recombinase family protein n=1 Tax=Bacillus pseudomycoides TaxID=64104 RepID=UPI000BF20C6A|nr:recombinase family protein [Bacillus pseudomycoides]PEK65565.1 integrase [Bacillus pseudomycoides]PGE87372.1 integrase [Bacillus pseudomycoides]
MGTVYGYARVSTTDQHITTQVNQLKEKGVEVIYKEKKSGKDAEREELQKLLSVLSEGDTLIVTKMDRIARSVKDGLAIVEELMQKGVTLNILNMGVFENTPTGRLMLNMLLSVAQFERDIMLERTREGIEEAKKRGAYKGRAKKYTSKNPSLVHALELYDNRDANKLTSKQIAEITQLSKATLYRAIKAREEQASE